ncbi:MAG: Fic family protein [Myxococcota bacterium]|nr:Fic family protein [Myxococcota bacterium]
MQQQRIEPVQRQRIVLLQAGSGVLARKPSHELPMATSQEKLVASLEELRQLQSDGSRVFASDQLSRTARERLSENGFLQEVFKGWFVSADPSARAGDTTPWFSSFWEFLRRYCEQRFGEDWFLSPEESLLLHAEKTAVPKQVIVSSPGANNKRVALAHGTSLFAFKKEMPAQSDLILRDGLRLYSAESALVRVTEEFFRRNPIEAQVALLGIVEPSGLLARLLDGGHTTIAGRLAGAFRRMDRVAVADEIVGAMKSAGHSVRESDPFDEGVARAPDIRAVSPFVGRLTTLWESSRQVVLDELGAMPSKRSGAKSQLAAIDEVYKLDAYHSLSIEGYVVTSDLIERVASGAWDSENVRADDELKDALAARGYWLAFQGVRSVIAELLQDTAQLEVLRTAHREWYRNLFAPHVSAGLIKASMLAGYRTQAVFMRGSRHIPPRAEVLRVAMPALFDLIEAEPSAVVRAVLGHWLFGYVHPFPDGNGRIARFLMNALLVDAGYSWTVIRVEDRSEYLAALEAASVNTDIRPFARFVARQMRQVRKRVGGSKRPKRRKSRS